MIRGRETDPGRLQRGRRRQIFNGACPADIADEVSIERTTGNGAAKLLRIQFEQYLAAGLGECGPLKRTPDAVPGDFLDALLETEFFKRLSPLD